MNKNMLIVLVGGLLIAVIVAVVVSVSLGRHKEVVARVEPPTQIVVAAKNLTAGTTLQDSDLKWQDWPPSSVFPGAVVKRGSQQPLEAITGVLLRPVSAGEPLLESAVIKAGKGNFVAASLDAGMRAVAISVSAQSTAGGFITPGDHVDLILTYRKVVNNLDPSLATNPRVKEMLAENLETFATETILQDVKVLAVDQTAEQPADERSGKVGRTVTLELSRRGSETVALATQLGQLTLALRNPSDTTADNTEHDVITDERITHIRRELDGAAHKLSGQNGNDVVRIYNGYNVQDQTVVAP